MTPEGPMCQVKSWKRAGFYCSPEVASHENWAIFSLVVLSYFVLMSTIV
ncbi:MAG: hypothetical protein WC465_02220 [Patescibacteria group bacterium]